MRRGLRSTDTDPAYSGWRLDLLKLRHLALNRLYMGRRARRDIVDEFHRLYYDSKSFGETWGDTRWLGVQTLKCPFDLWIYQEIISDLRPDLIIETGTFDGGSAFYLASVCDMLGHGEIITVDIEDVPGRPVHDRITYVIGSSVSDEAVAAVAAKAAGQKTVLVLLDSDHTQQHVLAELRRYHGFVTPGSYIVVEDTNINGHPVLPGLGPGPMEAVDAFLGENTDFEIDPTRERFMLTFNPRGYLRRKA